MSIPYFPMYPDDFEADTAHLTLAEDGAYNRLLRMCWRTPGCKLPADSVWIFRKLRAHTDDDKAAITTIIDEFFTTKAGKVFNERLLSEWVKANDKHARRISAGSKGGKAKSMKTNKTEDSNALALSKQPEPEPEPEIKIVKEEGKPSSKKMKRGTRLSEDWRLPIEWGRWAVSQKIPESVIRLEAEKFKDYWHGIPGQKGVKLDWQATWRNWMRNSKQPNSAKGNQNESSSKSEQRMRAFIGGAVGAP